MTSIRRIDVTHLMRLSAWLGSRPLM
jgi:hypothetical protein